MDSIASHNKELSGPTLRYNLTQTIEEKISIQSYL